MPPQSGHGIHCGQLILRKISKISVTRCQILRLKCTKFDFRRGSAPDPAGGAYSAPLDPLPAFKGPTSMGSTYLLLAASYMQLFLLLPVGIVCLGLGFDIQIVFTSLLFTDLLFLVSIRPTVCVIKRTTPVTPPGEHVRFTHHG